MTFVSRNTRFSRHFWVCYQALNTFNDVCSTPLQRNRSNHDLADRQARARLNLEYKARMDQAGRLHCSRSDLVMNKEDQFGDVQDGASWNQPPLHLTEAVQRLDLPQAEATEQHPKTD